MRLLEVISETVSRHVRAIDPTFRVEIEDRIREDEITPGHPPLCYLLSLLGKDHPYIHLTVYAGDQRVGYLDSLPDGIVQETWVDPEYSRRGIATAMWDAAVEAHDLAPDRLPDPKHSEERTGDGEAWIRSLERRGRPSTSTVDLSQVEPEACAFPARTPDSWKLLPPEELEPLLSALQYARSL